MNATETNDCKTIDTRSLFALLDIYGEAVRNENFALLGSQCPPAQAVTYAQQIRAELYERRQIDPNHKWAEKVTIHWAEGEIRKDEDFPLFFSSIRRADMWLCLRSYLAPRTGGYDKVKFSIFNLVPGVDYLECRIDLHHPEHGQEAGGCLPSLYKHCASWLQRKGEEGTPHRNMIEGILSIIR
jgi:hypothetical protein